MIYGLPTKRCALVLFSCITSDCVYILLSQSPRCNQYHHDDVIKSTHFQRYWPFVRGIHRSPVNSHQKGQRRGVLMFSLICAVTNGWVNNRDAGDLRRNRFYYDVTVTMDNCPCDKETRLYLLITKQWISFIVSQWRHVAKWILVKIRSGNGTKPLPETMLTFQSSAQALPHSSNADIGLEVIYLKFHPNLPGANEFNTVYHTLSSLVRFVP